ncbi:uncharacterized protein [Triticum aestivum]|uniref:uncharacterized protein isoform X2 n=1 Tax=Triticum aestivum TaxID=4565 RepID=UPI001D00FF2B|nr:uncharacterized protein LOC123179930 isoform X2 [Triticum aestivum]
MSTAKPLPRGQSRRPRPPPPRRRGGLAALATPIWRTQPRSGGRDLAAMVMGVASLLPPLAGAHRRGPGLARLPRTEARRSIAQQQAHRPRPTHGDLSNSGQDGRGQGEPLLRFHQYQVVGRGLPTPTEEHPRIYRMKLRVMFRCASAILCLRQEGRTALQSQRTLFIRDNISVGASVCSFGSSEPCCQSSSPTGPSTPTRRRRW